MRWRRLMWLLVAVVVIAVISRWSREAAENRLSRDAEISPTKLFSPASPSARTNSMLLAVARPVAQGRLAFRLTNTAKGLAELVRGDRAILLENALLDTSVPVNLPIPAQFQRTGPPGSYIVQARGVSDEAFRALLDRANARVVAYIPNNAYLVRASESVALELATSELTQAVLPYEPYYKLKLSLLEAVANYDPQSALELNILVFPDAAGSAGQALRQAGVEMVSEENSPFGGVVKVRTSLANLSLLALMPEVEALELAHHRVAANDLSRARLGVAVDSVTPMDYLGLTGTNILVNVNDTGVDAGQPGLLGRVLFDRPVSGTDPDGHGTHVAGIIAGDGSQSLSVNYAPGSSLPPANAQFRGQAPGAKVFAIAAGLGPVLGQSDSYLQQAAAGTNAFISNNSWLYSQDNEYDLAAASYDAAVRDALPGLPGSQPLLFVFPAGNAGHGNNDGSGGAPETIQSPATGKNVITVGAIEQPRFITNQTWTCTTDCMTNTPWLGMTDSSNEVSAFSSRGNVGVGIEGATGRLKPDVVAPGSFNLSTRATAWNQLSYYAQTNSFLATFPDTNYWVVLSNLNRTAGPYYRFESGTSLAAAEVSGLVALMEEFFQQRLGRTNSPALMKALLINGARSLGGAYGTLPAGTTNAQGWGLTYLPNSLPASLSNITSSANSMLLFDQDPQNALATGQSHTRYVSLSDAATNLPLRVTLVWSDPPGNPVAGVKLVNDLDLIVTNLDTGAVFWGNDIQPGSIYNRPWTPGSAANADRINNVENVYLGPTVSTRYSVTVLGRHVNVNALTANTYGVVQDYALVISSGNGELSDALTLTNAPSVLQNWAPATFLTNTFVTPSGDSGTMLLNERIGAGSPLLGTATTALGGNSNTLLTLGSFNQWRFYVCTNDNRYTNAAFLTFLSSPLASPVALLASLPNTDSGPAQSDIDLYVSTDPGLTNLDPQALAAADASVGRGGDEMIVYSNAIAGPYYIGAKCESGEGAQYGLLVTFTQQPFSQNDGLGDDLLRGFAAPAAIPPGTASLPGETFLFCLNPDTSPVHRVVATNTLTDPAINELKGTLSHGDRVATLNNHSGSGPVAGQAFLYDDSGENDFPGAQPSDGPGTLQAFAAETGFGQWRLTISSTNQGGSDESLGLFVESQADLTGGISVNLLAGACREDFLYLPPGVTNLSAMANLFSGGPVAWQLYPADTLASNCPSQILTSAPTNGSITIDATSMPPINPGLYASRLCNSGLATATVNLSASLISSPNPPDIVRFSSPQPLPIADEAISRSSIVVTNTQRVISADVGVRIDHLRISDLALTLISPKGTRVLLDENRGGLSAQGMGATAIVTNAMPVSSTGGPQASTNVLDTGETSGTLAINYDFFALPDDMRIYYQGQLLYDSGLVNFTGATNISYGPGSSTIVTIIMNEGGNFDTNTAWFYTVTSTHPVPLYFTFTENTNFTTVPIKFAPTPFTNSTYIAAGNVTSNGIYYLPEQSLQRLAGQSVLGTWTLELRDSRAGPVSPPPRLVSWQLSFLLENEVPVPIELLPGQPSTNLLGPGQIQWFWVETPSWLSFVTNSLVAASRPVNVLFNSNTPPTGTNAGDMPLLLNSTGGVYTLQTNGVPPLVPGSGYYLGIENTNAATVEFVFGVSFDVTNVITLQSGVAYTATNSGPMNPLDYYRYVVSTNAVRAQFEIDGPSTNMILLARHGRLPALANYDYLSANPGTNDQLIVLYNYSSPIPLTAGEWFLGAVNPSGMAASYSIVATEFPSYGTNITVVNPTADPNNFCLSWNSLPGGHYYVEGKTNLTDIAWITLSPTLTATDVLTTYCVALPSAFQFFRVSEGLAIFSP